MNPYDPETEKKLNEVIDSLEELMLEVLSTVVLRLNMYYDPSKFTEQHPKKKWDDATHPF